MIDTSMYKTENKKSSPNNETIKVSAKNLLQVFFVFLISVILYFVTDVGSDGITDEILRIKSIWLLIVYAFFVVTWVRVTRRAYSIFFFFLLYSIMSNAGQLILFVLGIEFDYNVNVLALNKMAVIKAIDYQMLCTAFYCTFGMIAWLIHKPKDRTEAEPAELPSTSSNISDKLFILSSWIYIASNVSHLSSRTSMSYGEAFAVDDSSSTTFYFRLFFYIMLFLSINKHRAPTDKFKRVIWLHVFLAGLTAVLYGSRNVIIPLIFGCIFMMKDEISKISKKKKFIIVLCAVLVMMFLNSFATIRHLSLSELTPSVVFSMIFAENPFKQLAALIAEMGGSIRVLTYTIGSIDSGVVSSEQTFLYSLLNGFLPRQIINALGFSQPVNWRLSSWITNAYGAESGWGYSMIAESYYNFVEYGAIYFAFFGYLFEALECKVEKLFRKGYTVIASVWLYVIAYAIFLARAETVLIATHIRSAVYVTVAAFILSRVKIKR